MSSQSLLPDLLPLDRLTPAAPRWIWPGRIPIGALTLFTGDPGVGKSTLALDIAARLTASLPWPDAPASETLTRAPQGKLPTEFPVDEPSDSPSTPPLEPTRPPAEVLYLGGQDDLSSVVLPRLQAAGGDPARFIAIQGIRLPDSTPPDPTLPFNLRHHLSALRAALDLCANPALILIDPLWAHLPICMSPDIFRSAVADLSNLAAEFSCALLAIGHLNKQPSLSALYRSTGNLSLIAATRCAHLIAQDPNHPDQCLLLNLKNNFAPASPGLAFRLAANRIDWLPDLPIPTSPDSALTPRTSPKLQKLRVMRQAADFLTEFLAETPQRSKDIFSAAGERAFPQSIVRQVAADLGVTHKRLGEHGPTIWRLPSTPDVDPPSADPFDFASMHLGFDPSEIFNTPPPQKTRKSESRKVGND